MKDGLLQKHRLILFWNGIKLEAALQSCSGFTSELFESRPAVLCLLPLCSFAFVIFNPGIAFEKMSVAKLTAGP